MPLFDEKALCPICLSAIGRRPTLGFDHLDVPSGHVGAQLVDSVAHRACLASWSRKSELVDEWNLLLDKNQSRRRLAIRPDGNVGYVTLSVRQRMSHAIARFRRRACL